MGTALGRTINRNKLRDKKMEGKRTKRRTRGEGGVRVCAKLGADVIQGGGEK